MMKRVSIAALLAALTLTLTACSAKTNRDYYQTAQLYLGCGDYVYAADLFEQLGEYEDSADYALYARALQAIEDEAYDLARANLLAIDPFKSSARYLTWLDAVQASTEGELEAALPLFEGLGTFFDAHLAAESLREAIPEAAIQEGRALMSKGEYAAARDIFLSLEGYGASQALADNCTAALNKAAYTEADKLCEAGDHLGAMAAFTALGDTLDAAERAEKCLAAIHKELDVRYAAVTLAEAPALMEAYAALGADETAQTRMAELTARYGRNLEVVTAAKEHPWVQLGAYPTAESGEEQPILWRVLRAEGSVLTLLSGTVLDAAEAAQTIALMFDEEEQSAVGEVTLPSVADLTLLNDLTCTATPYALAQGTASENGAALYWLRDSLENGLHPVIGASGALALPEENTTPGVRPMVTLSLENFALTMGNGTEENPFRAE